MHSLEVKVNSSIMLVRNLGIKLGLFNGTTLEILSKSHEVFTAQITSGSRIGNIGLIQNHLHLVE